VLIAGTILSGVIHGSLYALLGLAIVLIFRTTGVANFAQGDLAMFTAFIALMLMQSYHLPIMVVWVIDVLIAAAIGAVVYLVLIRPRPQATGLNVTMRTMGLFMFLFALAVRLWAAHEPYPFPSPFPKGTVALPGLSIAYTQLGALMVTLGLAAAFFAFFRFTQLGLAMRAVAINREVASLLGVNIGRITLVTWMLATATSAIVGVLVAPISFLETGLMRPYLLKAFTAAIMGGLTSFPGVLVGGLLLGVVESLATLLMAIQFRELVSFLVLLSVLLFFPGGIFGRAFKGRV
jgi:branched-chain amino acid transport system permease protein